MASISARENIGQKLSVKVEKGNIKTVTTFLCEDLFSTIRSLIFTVFTSNQKFFDADFLIDRLDKFSGLVNALVT